MTNKEKFKEVFGFTPQRESICPENYDCERVPTCSECLYGWRWWKNEYEPTCAEIIKIGEQFSNGFYYGLKGEEEC